MQTQLIVELERYEFDTQLVNFDKLMHPSSFNKVKKVFENIGIMDDYRDGDPTITAETYDKTCDSISDILSDYPADPSRLDQVVTLSDGTKVNLSRTKQGNWYASFLDPYDHEHNCEYVFYTFKEIVNMLNELFSVGA